MMPLKAFEEYLNEGTVRKQSPDKHRARALVLESEDSYGILLSFLENIKLDDKNANHIIKNSYDIVMELVRAKMLLDGYSTTGKGAHEAEVSYLAKTGFSKNDIEFANDMRWFRNGIMYYGKKFDKAYAENVLKFIKRIYPLLKKKCEQGYKEL